MNITPLKRKLLRAMAPRALDFRELAARRWELCGAESATAPPALYRPEDLGRVIAVMEDTTLEQERTRIDGGRREHAATVAFELHDAELLDGCLYKGATCHHLLRSRGSLLGRDTTECIEDAALACSLYGNIYFGHWMSDDITLYTAAEAVGSPIVAKRKLYGHEPGYCDLFGMRNREVERVRCAKITLIDDFGQNSYKRARYEQLRRHLAATQTSAKNERVVIGRGTQGSPRPLINTDEVHAYLASQGFVVIHPERMTPAEIVEQTLGARVVIGVEGSHMSHGLYTMAADGVFCFLQPPERFNNIFKDYTDCLGMKYAYAVGKPAERGFAFPLEDL